MWNYQKSDLKRKQIYEAYIHTSRKGPVMKSKTKNRLKRTAKRIAIKSLATLGVVGIFIAVILFCGCNCSENDPNLPLQVTAISAIVAALAIVIIAFEEFSDDENNEEKAHSDKK